ncbi:trypsin-like serine peptidase [Agrococcus beijingensis]|uniref:trypsin-like serine peptidase n=1 Tax=Agrococcus beijingensis TaxID=3068634 RepID=UPI0027427138|nr:hypothetical protein [Agrococcus sp. REN33]
MRLARAWAVVAVAAAALSVGGCILLPPPLPGRITLPPVTPMPPPAPTSDPRPGGAGAVEPDQPITEGDETAADTGAMYAGFDGRTGTGLLPDAAVDRVLPPTDGAPVVARGIAVPESDAGDELLPGVDHRGSDNLLLTTSGRLDLASAAATFSCSGTVINSDSGLVVLTAAHCIFDDETRDWYDRIAFSPGYERGEAPFGTWVAESWWVPQQYLESNERWLDGADDNGWMGFDFGFIRFAPRDSQTLEDAVGGQGVSFTAETNGVLLAGYPGNAPFDAEVLRYCADARLDYGRGGDPNYGTECGMGDGASGAAFVSNLDAATGAGHITAVYSNAGDSGAFGPPLGVTAWNGLQRLDD